MKTLKPLLAAATAALLPLSIAHGQAFSDLADNGDGTFTNWIGTVSPVGGTFAFPGFVDHAEHGLLYLFVSGEDVWIYDANVPAENSSDQFIYTSRDVFPFFYLNSSTGPGTWLRYVPGVEAAAANTRIFVPAGGGDPILLSKGDTRNIATLAGDSGLSTLVTAVGAADASIAAALTGAGPLTVFGPTNQAFANLGSTLDTVLQPENQGMLTDILLYHVISGELTAEDLTFDADDTLAGESNTFFIETLLGADLKFEVTSGGVLINGVSAVVSPNLDASNGIVHVIDEVLLPPENLAVVATNAGFSELVGAVGAADPAVAAALTGTAPLTVFAPTDEAFATFNASLPPEGISTAALTEALLYHVVAGKVYAADVPLDTAIPTVNTAGDTITITTDSNGDLLVNDAKILSTNVMAGNGVIHVIDKVLAPAAN